MNKHKTLKVNIKYVCTPVVRGLVPLKDCPTGLFMKGDTLCVKTEYGIDSYIVSSGEYFCGGAKTEEERGNILVLPLPDNVECEIEKIYGKEYKKFAMEREKE